MRIYGPNATNVAAHPTPSRRTDSATFTIDGKETARPAAGAAAARTIGGIDALMALQGVEDATERRRRAVGRGRFALDALDELKLGLLAGTLDAAALARLKEVAADLAEGSGEAGLDAVMAEISLRVEVELAKFAAPQPSRDRAK